MFTSARGFRRDCLFEGVRLVRVNSAFGMLFNAALVFCSVLTSEKLLSQTTVSARPNDTSAVLVKLSPPRLSFMVPGDMKLQFQVKPDGSVDSLQLISGPAVLVQRVLDSVRNSQFECRGCKEAVDSSLTFTFRVIGKPDPCCCSTGTRTEYGPVIIQAENHITITAPPPCVCPDECTSAWAAAHSRYRSARCLYLWKCASHTGGLQ